MKHLFVVLCLLLSFEALSLTGEPYNQNYDPERDPFSDFKLAQQDAIPEDKLILIILGGDWCSWCHRLGSFLNRNESIRRKLEDTFVVMKLNISDKNDNQDFLSLLPEPQGYPYFVIVNKEGQVVGAQNTAGLEQGTSYSGKEFDGFISRWQESNCTPPASMAPNSQFY